MKCNMKIKPKDIKVGVHPVSHKFEWESRGKWGGVLSPALRATDYKCPHCILIEYT